MTVHLPLLESDCWSEAVENGLSALEKRLRCPWLGGPCGEKKLEKTCVPALISGISSVAVNVQRTDGIAIIEALVS